MKTLIVATALTLLTLSPALSAETKTYVFGGEAALSASELMGANDGVKCGEHSGEGIECRFSIDGEGNFVAPDSAANALFLKEVKVETVSGFTPAVVHVQASQRQDASRSISLEFYVSQGKILSELPSVDFETIE